MNCSSFQLGGAASWPRLSPPDGKRKPACFAAKQPAACPCFLCFSAQLGFPSRHPLGKRGVQRGTLKAPLAPHLAACWPR